MGGGPFAILDERPQGSTVRGAPPRIDPAIQAAEVRQMLEAKSRRRQARGESALDVEAEAERLLAAPDPLRGEAAIDEELRAEVRQLVVARNERRMREGLEPLDVASRDRKAAGRSHRIELMPPTEENVYEVEELLNQPGTYFNPQTEVVVVVDDSASIDQEVFNNGGATKAPSGCGSPTTSRSTRTGAIAPSRPSRPATRAGRRSRPTTSIRAKTTSKKRTNDQNPIRTRRRSRCSPRATGRPPSRCPTRTATK